jgi:hypothetical protein
MFIFLHRLIMERRWVTCQHAHVFLSFPTSPSLCISPQGPPCLCYVVLPPRAAPEAAPADSTPRHFMLTRPSAKWLCLLVAGYEHTALVPNTFRVSCFMWNGCRGGRVGDMLACACLTDFSDFTLLLHTCNSIVVFWIMTPYRLVDDYQCFRGTSVSIIKH